MTQFLLLHSALGLRPAVTRFAAELGERGFDPVVPDYYDGAVFDDEDEGIAHRDRLGAKTLFKAILPVVERLDDDALLGGFSLGAAFAQTLAGSRPKASGVVLLHSVTAPRGAWLGQPVQVHRYARDHWIQEDDVAELDAAVRASGATFEDVVVPGAGHLFTDTDGPDGDADATRRSIERIARLA